MATADVVMKAILYREDGRLLALRRSKTAPIRPLEWDLPGGELELGEDANEGILREIKEETALPVEDLQPLHIISRMTKSGKFGLTICYTARSLSHDVALSFEHDQFRWIPPEEFQTLPSSPRLQKFVERFAAKIRQK